jgi:hypothetical protein
MSTKKYVLGVDPGVSGAMALIDCSDIRLPVLIDAWDFPTNFEIVRGKKRNRINPVDLALLVDSISSRIDFAVIEEVHSMPRDGSVSAFTFGFSAGLIRGILSANYIENYGIRPEVWKPGLGLRSDKQESMKFARRIFGDHYHFSRRRDHGKAEAALIAYFAVRTMESENVWSSPMITKNTDLII